MYGGLSGFIPNSSHRLYYKGKFIKSDVNSVFFKLGGRSEVGLIIIAQVQRLSRFRVINGVEGPRV